MHTCSELWGCPRQDHSPARANQFHQRGSNKHPAGNHGPLSGPDCSVGDRRLAGGELMRTALISEIVFMSGLAAGKLLSLFLDGWPSPILITYTIAELLLAGWGIYCLRSSKFSRIS